MMYYHTERSGTCQEEKVKRAEVKAGGGFSLNIDVRTWAIALCKQDTVTNRVSLFEKPSD